VNDSAVYNLNKMIINSLFIVCTNVSYLFFNMAHGSDGEAIAVQVSERIPCDKKEKYCECCIKMKVELSDEIRIKFT